MKDKRKAYEEKFAAQLGCHAANSHARSLAEAIILQSIEDLWDPMCKRGSLLFLEGNGFVLCSEIAGISSVKQISMFRMLANASPKNKFVQQEKGTLGKAARLCALPLKERVANVPLVP